MTQNKRESEEILQNERAQRNNEIRNLQGKEKLIYERDYLKSQIFNVNADIKNMGDEVVFENKLKVLKERLNKIEELLE